MNGLFRYIGCLLAAAVCLLGAVSCIRESYSDPDDPAANPEGKCLLVLHISPVDAREVLAAPGSTEKIRTLRVIILNEQTIEYNLLITIDDPATLPASQFRYALTLPTTAGTKEVYLVANEERVAGIEYQPGAGSTLPGDLPTSLQGLMERYQVAGSGLEPNTDPTPSRAEFKAAIEAAYWQPRYTPSGKELYLPYLAHYEGIQTEKEKQTIATMYLVPAATKFVFNFVNYRLTPVAVDEITLASVNDLNFLLARVGPTDYTKNFGTPEDANYMPGCYWIDWLAAVSEATQNSASNSAVNAKYGWILDYALPDEDQGPVAVSLVGSTDGDNADDSVPAGEEPQPTPGQTAPAQTIPGRTTFGPFYLPESRNIPTSAAGGVQGAAGNTDGGPDATDKPAMPTQRYTLNLRLHDYGPDAPTGEEARFSEELVISNLDALFRNTCVVITVTMRSSDVDVFAEIAGWNPKHANGSVVEDPSGPK